MEYRKLRQFFFSILFLLAYVPQIHATRVRLVNLEEMVRYADRIFWGVCIRTKVLEQEKMGLTVMEYTFKVREGFKGVMTGERITFRQILYLGSARIPLAGIPIYKNGSDLLLFLHGDSSIGLTSPVGMGQGLFRIMTLGDGRLGVVNVLENANLFYNTDTGEAIRSLQRLSVVGEKAIAMDDLASMISDIRRNQRVNR